METAQTLNTSFNLLSALISVIINGFLAGFIFLINPREELNKRYFVLSGFLAFWSFTMLMSEGNNSTGWKILMFQSIPWIGVSVWFFATSLVNRQIPVWLHGIFTGLATGLTIYAMIPGMMNANHPFFWWYSWGILATLYLTVGSALLLILQDSFRTNDKEEQGFYRGLFVSGFVGLAGGSSDLIIPGPSEWEFGNVAIALATIGLTWVLFRYRFLRIYQQGRFVPALGFWFCFHVFGVILAFTNEISNGWQWFAVWASIGINTLIFRQAFADDVQKTFQRLFFPESGYQDKELEKLETRLQQTVDFPSAYHILEETLVHIIDLKLVSVIEKQPSGKTRKLDTGGFEIQWIDVSGGQGFEEKNSPNEITITAVFPDHSVWFITGSRPPKKVNRIPVNKRFVEKCFHVFIPWLRQTESFQQVAMKNRLAKIGEMALTMAHEIRNPLSSINLAARNLTPENLATYQEIILEEVSRLNHLVESMLTFGRKIKPEITTFSLITVIRKLTEFFPALEIHIDENQAISGDPVLFQQVLRNLLQNSKEAKEDGKIRIISEGKNYLFVEDNGPGIPANLRTMIFEPFFTTKTTGTGLGLAMCRRYLEAMNMRIDLDSGFTGGTRWIIYTGGN